MKFETILRKAHVPDENTVAHLGFPVCVCKQKEVVTVHTESFFRQLGTPSASFLTVNVADASPLMPGTREEGNGKAAVRQCLISPWPIASLEYRSLSFPCPKVAGFYWGERTGSPSVIFPR